MRTLQQKSPSPGLLHRHNSPPMKTKRRAWVVAGVVVVSTVMALTLFGGDLWLWSAYQEKEGRRGTVCSISSEVSIKCVYRALHSPSSVLKDLRGHPDSLR